MTFSENSEATKTVWDIEKLSEAPVWHPAETTEPGVRALFFDSVPYKGKPTRVFAYYGVPDDWDGQPLPAMVLTHGGSGGAYAEWVRQWTARGYAAISFDHFGQIPAVTPPGEPYNINPARNPDGGPINSNVFAEIDDPIEDQWTYHAVAAALLAHSLLRSFPEVDADRIGLTGISWGGYLTCIVASLDSRYQFAAPIYGSGFLSEDSAWLAEFEKIGPEKTARWNSLWDPSQYLSRSQLPLLWVNGTNDFAFYLNTWQKSLRLPRRPRVLSLQVRMEHGQHEGAVPEEIRVYADSFLKGGKPLAVVGPIETSLDGIASVSFEKGVPIVKAELNYTADLGNGPERLWETVPATLTSERTAEAPIPPQARAFFINITDERGLITSSEYLTQEPTANA
jgi:dienelactone hydrolase